ncbi:hypothetical protein ALC57_12232 [Trachymyrmex cornetzi]|uniref:Uncharacterized protein n=1 Tax=Trachymyrmex cornetzi TaxID=471704 RepID=A0A151J130_9HYME|nr:hypothetical protein ALC57_12232 [Trachymyrmex cornetzi]
MTAGSVPSKLNSCKFKSDTKDVLFHESVASFENLAAAKNNAIRKPETIKDS